MYLENSHKTYVYVDRWFGGWNVLSINIYYNNATRKKKIHKFHTDFYL